MLNNGHILTAAEMQRAEDHLINSGVSVDELMRRAGQGAAEYIWRTAPNMPTLVLCGPGNNGGDGYVIAQSLLEKGVDVQIAACGDPKTEAAQKAKEAWQGNTVAMEAAEPGRQFVDCLFGTGLTRPLAGDLLEQYQRLAKSARRKVAIDLPSGVETDSGNLLNPIVDYDLTIGLGAYKPAHFLEPARSQLGNLVGVDIGLSAKSVTGLLQRPVMCKPISSDHKYSRGLVAVVAGEMPGAASLTAQSAQRSGAGYAKIFSQQPVSGCQNSIVQHMFEKPTDLEKLLADPRIKVVVIGPGLGQGPLAKFVLDIVAALDKPVLFDADALNFFGNDYEAIVAQRKAATIITPHSGEFQRIYKGSKGSKLDQTRWLAKQSSAIVLYKGPDTVIANPDAEVSLCGETTSWLSTAGSGDVLAGIIAARFAVEGDAFVAAQQGQWLHTRSGQLAGPAFSPEMLIEHIPEALGECL